MINNFKQVLSGAFLALLVSGPMFAESLNIKADKSKVSWLGKKVLVDSSHSGTIKIKSGAVEVDKNKLKKLMVTIDMASITNKDLEGKYKKKLEDHLKNDDFFSVQKFPTSSFTSTEVKEISANKFKVKGNLTIKGKSHPAEFSATLNSKPHRHLIGELTFDRTVYGVKYGSGKFFQNLGDKVIADEIKINANLAY